MGEIFVLNNFVESDSLPRMLTLIMHINAFNFVYLISVARTVYENSLTMGSIYSISIANYYACAHPQVLKQSCKIELL